MAAVASTPPADKLNTNMGWPMMKHQRVPSRRRQQYEFDWSKASSNGPSPGSSSNRLPLSLDTATVISPPANSDEVESVPPEVNAVIIPWDFRTTFPLPLPEAIAAGVLDCGYCDADAIRAIHEEHAAKCLTLLRDLDSLEAARQEGVDPRTRKRPRTEESRQRLEQYLATEPGALIRKFDEMLSVYENGFGQDATIAFRAALQAWHRGIPVMASPAKEDGPLAIAVRPEVPRIPPTEQPCDELDALGGPRLPVLKPLAEAVDQGVFGHDENGDPVVPTEEEIEAITLHHADRLMELLDRLRDADAALTRASEEKRVALYQTADRASSAYQSALQLYAEDFGEPAARRLDAWVRHQVETDHGEVDYEPGHPWHYLSQGDHHEPMPVDEIQPGPVDGAVAAAKLPKERAKREKKLRAMRLEQQKRLATDRQRYMQLVELGAAALSDFDRNIAYSGDEELAWASAVALAYTSIRNGLGRLAWIEQKIVALLGSGDSTMPAASHPQHVG